jgi:hypothetical protein
MDKTVMKFRFFLLRKYLAAINELEFKVKKINPPLLQYLPLAEQAEY